MSRIRILPEALSNKIAAGEVVERPASVVKELIENAIDAQSTQVVVEVQKGGRALIRVSDNGVGMARDDALLAIERHATSKIYDESHLFSIATLGFRGEALPSIASVSDMEIVTKVESGEAATQIILTGGAIKKVAEVGAPKGSMISVKRLFFNTPARRKYLKTDQTEMGHVSDMVTRAAIAWPRIHFKFLHNGRALGNWGATETPLHRIAQVLKGDLEDHLHDVDLRDGDVRVQGFVASSDISRTTSRGLYVYVNHRFVRDKVLHHAILDGYAGRLMKGKFPLAVLFLSLPYDQVDVNVHPTKSSVRFQRPRQVHDAIARAVGKTLQSAGRPAWGQRPQHQPLRRPYRYPIFPSRGELREPTAMAPPMPHRAPLAETPRLWEDKPFSSLRIIGKLHNTYLVCESEEGLVLVDQHAAHERIVFETLKAGYRDAATPTQGLLIPERLDLSHREASILETLLKDLGDIGVAIEPFGARTYLVRSVPDILAGKPVGPLVMEIIEKVAEIGLASGLHRAVDECLIIMACHGAIRARESLSHEQMKALLSQLDGLDNPTHCPHGRPIFIRQSLHEIEREFRRVV